MFWFFAVVLVWCCYYLFLTPTKTALRKPCLSFMYCYCERARKTRSSQFLNCNLPCDNKASSCNAFKKSLFLARDKLASKKKILELEYSYGSNYFLCVGVCFCFSCQSDV